MRKVMLIMTSVKTIGDFISCTSENINKKDLIIDIESERIAIASVNMNKEVKCPGLSKCEEPPLE